MTTQSHKRRIRILLADDHRIIRETIRDFLHMEPDFDVVMEVSDGERAVEKALDLNPDVVILDIRMDMLDGIAATRRIKEARPAILVICCSMHHEKKFIEAACAAGASGYLVKSEAGEKIIQTVRTVMSGKTYFPEQ